MPKTAVQLLVLTLTTSLCLILPVQAETTSKTIVVPIEYPTIAVAIGNAKAGDTIMVKSGTYKEQALEISKALTIKSEFPYQAKLNFHPPTYLQTVGVSRLFNITYMYFSNSIQIKADDVTLSGFIITNDPMNVNSSVHPIDVGYVSANGDQIQITNNMMGTQEMPFHLSMTGNGSQAINNTVSVLSITGSYQTDASNHVRLIDISGSYNVFAGNIIEGDFAGISVSNGSYNVFYGNLLGTYRWLDNFYGLNLGGANGDENNNLFFGNIFLNSSRYFGTNLGEIGSNSFDNGAIGNYWDDYSRKYPNAAEIDGSGIGNTPYLVYGDVIDHYPLMNKPNVSAALPALPSPWSTLLTQVQGNNQTKLDESLTLTGIVFAVAAVAAVGVLVYVKKRKL